MMFLAVCNRNDRRRYQISPPAFFEYLRLQTDDGQELLPETGILYPGNVMLRP